MALCVCMSGRLIPADTHGAQETQTDAREREREREKGQIDRLPYFTYALTLGVPPVAHDGDEPLHGEDGADEQGLPQALERVRRHGRAPLVLAWV